jgi:hypothetical protein
MNSYEASLKWAKRELDEARLNYKTLRDKCLHPENKLLYKEKYGGYYCSLCDRFLPRDFKKGESI